MSGFYQFYYSETDINWFWAATVRNLGELTRQGKLMVLEVLHYSMIENIPNLPNVAEITSEFHADIDFNFGSVSIVPHLLLWRKLIFW